MGKQVIWKAELSILPSQVIEIPAGAVFLAAREQNDHVCVWFTCDPDAPNVERTIGISGTGHPTPDGVCVYIGTAVVFGGNLVWHVFEIVK